MPTYAQNKKALHDFEVLEEIEAGLVLSGQEVKAIRNGQAKLKGAYVVLRDNGGSILNMHISKYKYAGSIKDYNPTASRKILLTKKQLDRLRGKSQEKGLTIVPVSLYTSGRFVKVKLALVKGKKTRDKREDLKKKDQKRQIQQALKGLSRNAI